MAQNLTGMAQNLGDEFEEFGFVGPFRVFDKKDCRHLLKRLAGGPPAIDWFKGHAASSRTIYEVATHPSILNRVSRILGEDVMLWGASVVRRPVGFIHPWHTDIESSFSTGRTVSAWVALANTNAKSSLEVMPGTHRLEQSVQERAAKAGRRRYEITTEDVLAWARDSEPQSRVARLTTHDGEAILFHGRLWHSSHNKNRSRERIALLLQYAVPAAPIRIPDFKEFEWPFYFLDFPHPPCIMVRGSGRRAANKLVSPPAPQDGTSLTLTTRVQTLDLPLDENPQTGWKPYPLFSGRTNGLTGMSCHVSVLSPGITPHEPHHHPEEELLIMLDGEAELLIVDGDEARTQCLQPGSFVYYSDGQKHTIRNAQSTPITYLMFKWRGPSLGRHEAPMQSTVVSFGEQLARLADAGQPGFSTRRVFEGRTQYLHKLHAHVSTVAPGSGYDPHVDAYDVAILVLNGTIETLGRTVGPYGIVFYSAGQAHGLRNPGDVPAQYLVFEFHGTAFDQDRAKWSARLASILRPVKRSVSGMLPPSVKRLLKPLKRTLKQKLWPITKIGLTNSPRQALPHSWQARELVPPAQLRIGKSRTGSTRSR